MSSLPALRIEQLSKVYGNGKVALNGIDLTVERGDFFALLGQNGAGKSTTIGIISSLVKKTSGKVWVFGYDIDTHWMQAKSCIGIVPQEINFAIFENIFSILLFQAGCYGIDKKTAQARAERYLKIMELWDARHLSANRLSGGMKRRLMIARAMMNEPPLLILDEPTAGVDVEIRRILWDFLKEINGNGTSIILTTHYLEEAEQLCKHLAIIDEGSVIKQGSLKAFMRDADIQTFILDLKESVSDIFLTLSHQSGWQIQKVGDREIEVILNKKTLNELFAWLSAHQLTVLSLRNKTNRLEELFIQHIQKNKSQ